MSEKGLLYLLVEDFVLLVIDEILLAGLSESFLINSN